MESIFRLVSNNAPKNARTRRKIDDVELGVRCEHLHQIIDIVGVEIVQIFVERADARFARLQAVESSPQLIEFVGHGFVPRLSLIR